MSQPDPATTWHYRAVDVEALPVGDDLVLARPTQGGLPAIIDAHALGLLHRCTRFATLAQHSQDRCRELSLDDSLADAMREELQELARAGLLVSREQLSTPAEAQHDEPPAAISTVCWPTRDRRLVLERGMTSFAENLRRHGRTCELVISDDTEDPTEAAAIRAMARRLGQSFGLEARFAGLSERREYASALARESGVDPRVVHFALFGLAPFQGRYGANRNALLLDTSGSLVLSADDDVVCRVAEGPEHAPGLALSSALQPQDFWFFDDREAGLRAAPPVERDILALHERVLGRDLRQAIAAHLDEGVHLDDMDSTFVGALATGGGRTAVSIQGIVGDSGICHDVALSSLPLRSRARLLANDSSYLACWNTREILRATVRTTIGQSPVCIATTFAMDGRELLAPFLPVLPSEDALFGTVYRRAQPDRYTAYLPWVLTHAPVGERPAAGRRAVVGANVMYAGQIVDQSASVAPLGPADVTPAARLAAMGRFLCELGGMKDDDFAAWARQEWWRMSSTYIGFWEALLEQSEHELWSSDLRQRIESTRAPLLEPDFMEVGDPNVPAGQDEARRVTRGLVRGYGELLQAWPRLVLAARALRAAGRRMTVPA